MPGAERCPLRAAGMCDYATKPIKIDVLVDTLLHAASEAWRARTVRRSQAVPALRTSRPISGRWTRPRWPGLKAQQVLQHVAQRPRKVMDQGRPDGPVRGRGARPELRSRPRGRAMEESDIDRARRMLVGCDVDGTLPRCAGQIAFMRKLDGQAASVPGGRA